MTREQTMDSSEDTTAQESGIKFVRTVAAYVEDQARAEAFYTEVLGFEVRARIPMDEQHSWVEVAPPGETTRLVLYPKSMMKDWQARRLSIVFGCQDTFEVCRRLAAKGVKFVQEPQEMPWGYVFAIFTDPDGNEFGLTNQP